MTLLVDGAVLYRGFNHGRPSEEAAELMALAEVLGYFIEMGFARSFRFYLAWDAGS